LGAARLGDVALFDVSMTPAQVISTGRLGFVSVNIPWSTPLQAVINGRLKTFGSNCAYVHDPEKPFDFRFSEEASVFVINLFKQPLDDTSAAIAGGTGSEPSDLPELLPLRHPAGQAFRRFAAFLWSEIQAGSPLATAHRVVEELEKGLMSSLLLAADLQQHRAGGTVPPACLRRAVDFIMAHLSEPLSLGEVAGAAGVHARTLQRSFHAQYGMSVMRFVRECRLRQAYDQLLAADTNTTSVSDVALANGFWHLARFSFSYRRRFGELPSETLRR
jgi:AraC-like DNA-binding protein